MALSLALRPPSSSRVGRKLIPLPSRGLAGLSPAPRPRLPTAGPAAGADRSAGAAEPLMQLISERHGGCFSCFSHWRSYSLQPNIPAQGSTKLIKIALSQSSGYGRGSGSDPFLPEHSAQAVRSTPGEGTVTLGRLLPAISLLPKHRVAVPAPVLLLREGQQREAALVRREAPVITEKDGSLGVQQITPGQE